MSIYLDNAATTQVCPEAAEAAMDAMTVHYANPSSTHAAGREAAKMLEHARGQVAHALGCKSGELVFTSCGSEGDNWAVIRGAEYQSKFGRHVISSSVEHSAVLKSLEYLVAHGFEVTRLKPEQDGGVAKKVPLESVLRLPEDLPPDAHEPPGGQLPQLPHAPVSMRWEAVTVIFSATMASSSPSSRMLLHSQPL